VGLVVNTKFSQARSY